MRSYLHGFLDELVKLADSKKPVGLDIGKVTVAPARKPVGLDIGKVTVAPAPKPIALDIGKVTASSAQKPSPLVKRAAFADELVRLLKLGAAGAPPAPALPGAGAAAPPAPKPPPPPAGAKGLQAKIDAKLAPFKPTSTPPMQGPSAKPPVSSPAKPLEQRMGESFADIRGKASRAGGEVQIKTPRTTMGVRG